MLPIAVEEMSVPFYQFSSLLWSSDKFPGELCEGHELRLERFKRLDSLPKFIAIVKVLF